MPEIWTTHRHGTRLLERSDELTAARALIESGRSGVGQTVLLVGPAGIGKTAVLEAAKLLTVDSDVSLASATGSELERDYAFGAVRQLLGHLVTKTERTARTDLFAGAAAPAAPVLGLRGTESQPSPLPEDPAAVMHGLYWLVANLSEQRPLLLVADDIHWFDPPSQRFLAYLARRVGDLPVSLLLASRPFDAHNDVLHALLGEKHVSVLTPAPLSVSAVGEIVADGWDDAADAGFVTACHEAGNGNPFLTEQLIRALHEAGVKPTAASAAAVLSIGSRGARRQVLTHLARLAPDSVEVVRAIAVLGPDATVRRIATLAEAQTESQVSAHVEALAAAGLIFADQPLRFAHPLIRAAIYQDMAPALRAWWHGRVARSLDDIGVPRDRVAAHLMLVEPEANSWVLEVLMAAAADAQVRGAPDAAAALYRRALAEGPPPSQRVGVLLLLGGAEYAAGEVRAVEHLQEALIVAENNNERVNAAWLLSGALVTDRRADEAVATLDRLHDDIEDQQTRFMIEAAIVQAGMASPGGAPRARPRLQAFASLAQVSDPQTLPPPIAAIAACAGWCLNVPAEKLASLVTSAFERARLAAPMTVPPWAGFLASAGICVEAAGMLEIIDWILTAAREQGDLPTTAVSLADRSLYWHRRGAPMIAAADADAAIEAFCLAGVPVFVPWVISLRTYCHLERGELREARLLIESRGFGGPMDDTTAFHSNLAHGRGLLNLAEGHLPEAVADLRDAGRRFEICSWISPSLIPWRSDLALALFQNDDRVEAARLATEELELARAFGLPRQIGIALRAAGLTDSNKTSGEETLRRAVTALSNSASPVELARTLVELGAMMRRRGARTDARQPLKQALELASGCGALAVAERARTELVASGARPRRPRSVGVDSLTVTETRTVELAAAGATNKQIAQTMFVTVKTVETHLAHAYQKLGITRRADLPGAGRDRRPLPGEVDGTSTVKRTG